MSIFSHVQFSITLFSNDCSLLIPKEGNSQRFILIIINEHGHLVLLDIWALSLVVPVYVCK